MDWLVLKEGLWCNKCMKKHFATLTREEVRCHQHHTTHELREL